MVFRRITEEVDHCLLLQSLNTTPNSVRTPNAGQKRQRHMEDDRLTDFKRVRLVEKPLQDAPGGPAMNLESKLSPPHGFPNTVGLGPAAPGANADHLARARVSLDTALQMMDDVQVLLGWPSGEEASPFKVAEEDTFKPDHANIQRPSPPKPTESQLVPEIGRAHV